VAVYSRDKNSRDAHHCKSAMENFGIGHPLQGLWVRPEAQGIESIVTRKAAI